MIGEGIHLHEGRGGGAHHPLDDALHLVVPDLLRARHVDEADARDEGAEEVRADEGAAVPHLLDGGDVREDREGDDHQEDVHLIARLHLHEGRGYTTVRGGRGCGAWGVVRGQNGRGAWSECYERIRSWEN